MPNLYNSWGFLKVPLSGTDKVTFQVFFAEPNQAKTQTSILFGIQWNVHLSSSISPSSYTRQIICLIRICFPVLEIISLMEPGLGIFFVDISNRLVKFIRPRSITSNSQKKTLIFTFPKFSQNKTRILAKT